MEEDVTPRRNIYRYFIVVRTEKIRGVGLKPRVLVEAGLRYRKMNIEGYIDRDKRVMEK